MIINPSKEHKFLHIMLMSYPNSRQLHYLWRNPNLDSLTVSLDAIQCWKNDRICKKLSCYKVCSKNKFRNVPSSCFCFLQIWRILKWKWITFLSNITSQFSLTRRTKNWKRKDYTFIFHNLIQTRRKETPMISFLLLSSIICPLQSKIQKGCTRSWLYQCNLWSTNSKSTNF